MFVASTKNPMSGNHAQKKQCQQKHQQPVPCKVRHAEGNFFMRESGPIQANGLVCWPALTIKSVNHQKNLRIRSGEIVLPPTPCGQRLTVNTKIGNRKAFGSVSNQLKVCRPGLRCWYISKQICVWNPKFW